MVSPEIQEILEAYSEIVTGEGILLISEIREWMDLHYIHGPHARMEFIKILKGVQKCLSSM